ncbi:MAG: 4-hydroxybenzoate octaprenyltransferase [Deltaproteobacteria bacterium]|nr:4-hydroxybenzoate octaprenyltransferase [Deltaproteobacteria bacterium]
MSQNTITIKKLVAVSDLIRLPKQYGTLLVLWPTLWSLFIASKGEPPGKLLIIFILGAFLMRSAGCAINDIADRDLDPLVERTRTRPLVSGTLNVREALFVFAALLSLAFILALFLNPLTILLSVIGALLASVYPFVKRVSYWPQTVLGMAFGWGAVMAWSAVKGSPGIVAALIFLANIFWAMAYDTIYALMDKEDDIRAGVKSTAVLFGARVYPLLGALYAAFTATLLFAGYLAGQGVYFYCGVVIAFASSLWIIHLVKTNPLPRAAFKGFVANVAVGGIILASIIMDAYL